MKRFCAESGQRISFLPSTPEALTTLFTHLLYDDSKRIVFCYVPKNGCSNMKRLLLILNGLLPPESAQQNRPSETVLKKVCHLDALCSVATGGPSDQFIGLGLLLIFVE